MAELMIDPSSMLSTQVVTVFVSSAPAAAQPGTGTFRTPDLPLSVPSSQLYYWSRLWREGVRISRDAVADGDYVDFDSDDPSDVLRWLFEDDGD